LHERLNSVPVVNEDEDTPVLGIYEFLCRVSIRRVVIVSDGFPTGVISRGSLLQWFSNWAASKDASATALTALPG
jgi:hypothetical protein